MSRRRRIERWLTVLLVPSVSGCVAFQPVALRPGPGAPEVEVRFSSPRTVTARGASGEELVWRRVTRLAGRPFALRGDTLVIAVGRWASSGGWEWLSPPATAALIPDERMVIGNHRFSLGGTVLLVVVAPVVGVLLWYVLCAATDCYYT